MDIAKIAREAGFKVAHGSYGLKFSGGDFEKFALLVAAKEREACASICDDLHHEWRFGDGEDSASGPKECAGTIRERSNLELTGRAKTPETSWPRSG